MPYLNREALLTKQVLQIEKVNLGGDDFVFVREMTGRERDLWEKSILLPVRNRSGDIEYRDNFDDFRAKLAVSTLCDEDGVNLFTIKDVGTLSQAMGAGRLEKIVNVAQRLNEISAEDKENLVKNLEGGGTAASISDSV